MLYEFNKNDELDIVFMKENKDLEVVFSRDEEIKNLKERIEQLMNLQEKSVS